MLVCVGGCLLKRQDRPNVLWEIAFTQERFKDDWIFNNLPLAKFDFWKFWKSTTFLFLNSRFFCFCLTMFTKRICYNWNRRWVRSALKPSSYILCLGRWVSVYNKRGNGWTDQVQIFCGTSHDPREGLWMRRLIDFRKILKIH